MRSTDAVNAPSLGDFQGEQDLGPLAWVLDELRKSLDGTVKALRRFVYEAELARGSDLAALDTGALRLARQQLHQASGALEMVGMGAPALVLRAMESAVQKFVQRPELCTDEAGGLLERASFAVAEYLENVLAGKAVSAVALFPQYRDVQLLNGVSSVHPADLWPVERRHREPELDVTAAALAYGPVARARLDQAVLKIVKSADRGAARDLRDASLGFAAGQGDPRVRSFWKISAGFFEAFSLGLVKPDVYVKRVTSRILMQYATLAKGEPAVTDRLVQDLLFFCAQAEACAPGEAPALYAVRQVFELERFPAVDYETRRFGRFDPAVLAQARKRIAAAAETWAALAGGDRQKFKLASDQFSLVCDSLRKLQPGSEGLAQALTRAVDMAVRSGEPPVAGLAMEVATSVLYLQATLEELDTPPEQLMQRAQRLAERLGHVCAGAEPQPLESWMEELYRRVSDHQTMGSVVGELRATLAEAERAMDQFFRDPQDMDALASVPTCLAQMRGVLSVLGLDQASLAVARMRETVEHLLGGHISEDAARHQAFEKLGNSLGTLGFMIDMLSYQRALARKLFVYDETLGELRSLMGRDRVRTDDALQERLQLRQESPGAPAPVSEAEALPASVPASTAADAETAFPPQHIPSDAVSLPELPAAVFVEPPVSGGTVLPAPVLPAEHFHSVPAVQEGAAPPAALVSLPESETVPEEDPLVRVTGEAHSATLPVPSAPSGVPAAHVTQPVLDDELLEIFLEEVREVVLHGKAALRVLGTEPDAPSEQTTLRRAFHTLKGSSRMVGLREFGDAAWAVEELLNFWLAEQKPMHAPLLQLAGQALQGFGCWATDIETGDASAWQASAFICAADAMRNGRELPLLLPVAVAASVATEVPEAAQGPETAQGLPAAAPLEIMASVNRDPLQEEAKQEAEAATEALDDGILGSPADSAACDVSVSDRAESEEGAGTAPDALVWCDALLPEPANFSDTFVPLVSSLPESDMPLLDFAVPVDFDVQGFEALEGIDLPSLEKAEEIDFSEFAAAFADAKETEPETDSGPAADDRQMSMQEGTADMAGPEEPFGSFEWSASAEEDWPSTSGELVLDWDSLDKNGSAAVPAVDGLQEVEFSAEVLAFDKAEQVADTDAAPASMVQAFELLDLLPGQEPAVESVDTAVPARNAEPLPESDAALPAAGSDLPDSGGAGVAAPELDPEDAGDEDAEDDEAIRVIGSLRIGIPLYNVYLNEADEWSRRLVTELQEWSLELHQPVPGAAIALSHSLAGSSATVGFLALSDTARLLEHALAHVQLQPQGLASQAAVFVAASEDMRRLLHQLAAGFLKEANPSVVAELHLILATEIGAAQMQPGNGDALEQSSTHTEETANATHRQSAAADAPKLLVSVAAPEGSAVDTQPSQDSDQDIDDAIARAVAAACDLDDDIDALDVIDPDLFQFFEDEALELLPSLGSALRQWAARPGNLGARNEVLRALHTLKGSSRLAGALRLGEMAHRMESAIEQLNAETVRSEDIEPLLASFDGLQANFDALRTIAAQPRTEGSAAPVASPPLARVSGVEEAFRRSTAAPVVLPPTLLAPTLLAPTARAAPLRAPSGQSVRVRAQLLDRLVNQAGEVMMTRARLEAHLGQLKGSLSDLSGNLERLRRQLRDIEVQSESQMQSRLALSRDSGAGFDPLEFDRFTRVQELTRMMAESVNDVATVQRNLQRAIDGTEDELVAQGRQARELQRDLLRTRMVEFEGISERLYAVVRQSSKETGKQVRLDIVGGSIEMDRGVLDRMAPAFEHLLRNCVAHGIETPEVRRAAGKPVAGTITVALQQEGNDVSVEFRDDGAGLDVARIRAKALAQGLVAPDAEVGETEAAQLIFAPGFTTAAVVTEISGRGIGMDVVRSEVDALGGRIDTTTRSGQGSAFRMVLPLTTAVTQVVMLRMGSLCMGVPASLIEVVRRVPAAEVQEAYRSGNFDVGGTAVPFYWAGQLMQASQRSSEPAPGKTLPVVVLRSAAQRIAMQVDQVLGNQEVVVKNLGPQLSRMPGLAGMSVLASGAVVLIYNPVALSTVYGEQLRNAALALALALKTDAAAAAVSGGGAAAVSLPLPAQGQVPLVLVVDDSITVRRVTQRLLQREGYRVILAADGLQALERLQDERPAVVLSDIEMPRMDGFDLARNIRADAALADLPIIMITSRIAQKHRDLAMELGVNHYLGKPYSDEELLGLVHRYSRLTAEMAPV